jgi:hypothetical protein
LQLFVPITYADFGEPRIAKGQNHTFDIGHGIWTIGEFEQLFSALRAEFHSATTNVSDQQLVAAFLTSQLLPDRVPFL